MTQRTEAQKTGARGHRWLALTIEEHPHWLARELGEDYGIDLEAELTEQGVRGEIIKIQIKSTEQAERDGGRVKAVIDRKYLEYAESCRYPVIFVVVDTATKESWYIWLQEWLHQYRSAHGELDRTQASWTTWISATKTLAAGLDAELKAIARWEGETQLALSLTDGLRAAAAIYNGDAMSALINLIDVTASKIADISMNVILKEALRLGDRLRATNEGNAIAQQLFGLVRKFGGRISLPTISAMVLRGESISRTGVIALGILYDEHFEHICSLKLPEVFTESHPELAYYCAFREANRDAHSGNPFTDPKDFTFAGLKYIQPDMYWDKYANRGPSAILEYLVPISYNPGQKGA